MGMNNIFPISNTISNIPNMPYNYSRDSCFFINASGKYPHYHFGENRELSLWFIPRYFFISRHILLTLDECMILRFYLFTKATSISGKKFRQHKSYFFF